MQVRWTFVQLAPFVADWRRLRLTDEDPQALEMDLQRRPGAVVPGTGGLRKLRFAPPSWHTGKSGATRVIHAVYPEQAHIFLVLLNAKNEQGNLTSDEKAQARQLMSRIDAQMRGKP